LRALLERLIDYAGLFPPAVLDMLTAVRNYARYLRSENSWMLARFVVPCSRLAEFQEEQTRIFDEQASAGQAGFVESEWRLSCLLGLDPMADVERIAEFNVRNAGRARIDSVEAKITNEQHFLRIATLLPVATSVFFEIAPERAEELLNPIRNVEGRAKIRTGGITPDTIPPSEAVASFLIECAHMEVPFKATAGLHHPLRCTKPLTYEPNAPVAAMHGFLNVFIAAVLAYTNFHVGHAASRSSYGLELSKLLGDNPELHFTDDSLAVHMPHGPVQIDTAAIRNARRKFAMSFGSCSFEEPVSELLELKLL
jgi:hypothetical protein